MIEVLKASAGAGKTHRLTGEYIELLFSKDYAFKNILAVTFTNKATDEMKQRILEELHKLSQPGVKSDYLERIMELTGKDEMQVRQQAKEILVSILHDYTSFRVSTIDKFFQLVMRSFARELGKMATYNVELDQYSVLARAVDKMFAQLDDPKNRKLLEWLIDYSLEAVDKGSSWNVKGEILNLGSQIFSEEFKLAKEECSRNFEDISIDEVAGMKNALKAQVEGFEKDLASLAREGIKCLADAGMDPSGFKGGSRSPFFYFGKVVPQKGKTDVVVPSATFMALHDDISKWYTGKKCPADIEAVYPALNGVVGKIVSLFENGYRGYATAMVLLSNVNVLGILNDIYVKVMEYCRENNIILLSESTELLGKIIDGSDTPFVYEKIGAKLENYMLDEFQDTSSLQWRNFLPLLTNSQSEGHRNLIVGDVKQSIYRWRGSDWNILKDEIYDVFGEGEIEGESLQHNYRSTRNIIEFNNAFFGYCAAEVQGIVDKDGKDISAVYSDLEQKLPEGKQVEDGYVEVDFIDVEEADFYEQALEMLPQKVAMLLDGGYSQKDIAVLVRTGREGNLVAEKLLACGYDVISSDSLYVASSVAVQKVVNILREADNPDSDALRIMRMFQNIPKVEHISQYSLYQLCEAIIRESLEEEEKKELAYLQAFLDLVLEFTNNKGTNIPQFIKWWDESGVKCTISAPEDMDAIRVMTIHKSKGLGFNVVIVPFLKENLDHKPQFSPTLWCGWEGMPMPVRYGKVLQDTYFEKAYGDERIATCIDALNTVYVAFTRAKKEMFIFAPAAKLKKSGDYAQDTVSDILYSYCKDVIGLSPENTVVIGESGCQRKQEKSSGKLMLQGVFDTPLQQKRIRTSAQSGSLQGGETIREHGIAMHYVFSLVKYAADAADAVARACREGVATCGQEELLELVGKKIASVKELGWFDEKWEVLNECSILTENGDEKRPDRVLVCGTDAIVIDYKFGAYSQEDTAQLGQYKRQVGRYKELLTCMGYTNVEGYLWYLSADKVISV